MMKLNFLNFPFITFIVYLVLKLIGIIDWSWLWVTSPIWIPISFVFILFFIIFNVILFMMLFGFDVDKIKDIFNVK